MRKHSSTKRKIVRRKPVRGNVGPRRMRPLSILPGTVYKFESTKSVLGALPEDARCILLLGGHIVNELTTLNRLLLFTMKSSPDPVEATYVNAQSLILIRLLIGKVAEGLEVFQKRILGKPFGQSYVPLVEKRSEGKRVIVQLRSIVGRGGLLRRLRNAHTFHNPTDDHLRAAFEKLGETEDWSMMTGTARHTILFPMSHVVTTQALLDETGLVDARKAIEMVRDEVLGAAGALILFFEHLTMAMADTHDLFVRGPIPAKDTSSLPNGRDVSIPPLCRDVS